MGRYVFDHPNITAANSAIGDNAAASSHTATVTNVDQSRRRLQAATQAASTALDEQGLNDLARQLRELATTLEAHLVHPPDAARLVDTTEELSREITKEPSKARAVIDRLSAELRTTAALLGSIEALREAVVHAIR